jgi:hypothetical protein
VMASCPLNPRPCKVDEVVKDHDSMGMGFMTYKGL